MAQSAPPVHDLRERSELTFALLNDFGLWRERLVEEVVVEDGDHVTAAASYQIRLPLDVVQQFWTDVESGDLVRMLLPLTTRPKELLLGVDLLGPGESACFLLLKEQIAWIQREYAYELIGSGSQSPGSDALLYAISNYTVDIWAEFEARFRDPTAALVAYLKDGLPFEVDERLVVEWQQIVAVTEDQLSDALGEPPDRTSASENLLRALPFVDELPTSSEEVGRWLADFRALVETAEPAARAVIAEYGRRWEVIVETVITVDQPCKVKLITKRPWGSSDPRRTTQRISIGDAATAHIEVRIADHSVEFAGPPELTDLWGERLGVPVVDSLRYTADTAAIYVSNGEDTPYFVDVAVELRPRRPIRVLISSIWVMVVFAIGVAILLPEGDQLAANLALLTFPLTLAGAIVLTRDTSAVSHRLQERSRVGLAIMIALLWLVAALRLVASDVDLGWLGETLARGRDALERL